MKQIHSRTFRFSIYTLLALFTFGLTACDSSISGVESESGLDIVETASSSEFTTLSQAIEAAGLTETLRSDGPFTVFAPTNEAFAKLPESAIRTLLHPDHKAQLAEVLRFHVVPGRVYANEILQNSAAKITTFNTELNFKAEGEAVYVNNARIVTTDIEASNGLIHVIDTVLLPEWLGEWLTRNEIAADPLDQN